ncbi:MAG: hypothetical protein RXR82_07350 [Nitrososphaeria archaeon]
MAVTASVLRLLIGDPDNNFLGVILLVIFLLGAVAIALLIVDIIGITTGALNLAEALAP